MNQTDKFLKICEEACLNGTRHNQALLESGELNNIFSEHAKHCENLEDDNGDNVMDKFEMDKFEEKFEKGMRDLRNLKNALDKVYFGDIECYLEEMVRRYKDGEFGCHPTDEDLCNCSDYIESLNSFRDFKPIFQRFVLALRELPNFR